MKLTKMRSIFASAIAIVLCAAVAHAEPTILIQGDVDLPETVTTDSGTYLVIPDYTTGKPMTVIQVSKGDEDE